MNVTRNMSEEEQRRLEANNAVSNSSSPDTNKHQDDTNIMTIGSATSSVTDAGSLDMSISTPLDDKSISTSISSEESTIQSNETRRDVPASLFVLPDELISMCYDGLPAQDLTSLEMVNRRLREMVSNDGPCWRTCVKTRYANSSNASVMDSASTLAGGWKKFYEQKVRSSKEHAPWVVPSTSETLAIIDLIKGRAPPSALVDTGRNYASSSDETQLSNSPSSIMQDDHDVPQVLSIVLLIDGSSSVTEDDFAAMKDFTRALIASLRMTHPNAAVALVQFNQYPRIEVNLSNVDKSDIMHGIDSIEQMMGSTDIAAPIRRARQMLMESAGPGEKAIILLSDGQTHADELEESEKEATIAAEMTGARLFALGVGRDVDEVGLTRVSSGSRTTLEGNGRPRDMNGAYFTLRRLKK